MRAQRAGFLLHGAPIVTDDIAEVFTDALELDWHPRELERATSVLALPTRHDVKAKPNRANIVPLFSFRILREAKAPIREYLARVGLIPSTIYPDLGGLVRHLARSVTAGDASHGGTDA